MAFLVAVQRIVGLVLQQDDKEVAVFFAVYKVIRRRLDELNEQLNNSIYAPERVAPCVRG